MEKANNPNNYSAATLKALARFERGNASSSNPANKSEPLPLPGTDWELWAHMSKATLAEAVAVSLGINPSSLKPGSGYAEPGKDLERRLKLACAFVSHAGPLKSLDELPPNHLMHGPETATVSLPHFAAWALSMGWELPDKFPRLKTAPPQPTTNSTAPTTTATQNPLYVAIQQIVKSELQKHKPAPVVPTEPQAATLSPAPVVQAPETKEQRQDRRLDACEKYRLVMPKSYLSRLPDGVGDVAKLEEVTRQAFSKDVKAALKRRESATREGRTVHRI